MSMEESVTINPTEDKEPIYFAPKRVSLISDVASILSWLVLVGAIADLIIQLVNISSQMKTGSLTLAALLREPSFYSYLFVNIIVPVLTGLGLFTLLQAASVGLNMLLEADYNAREGKSKA